MTKNRDNELDEILSSLRKTSPGELQIRRWEKVTQKEWRKPESRIQVWTALAAGLLMGALGTALVFQLRHQDVSPSSIALNSKNLEEDATYEWVSIKSQ
jgi:hypothetical protein